MPSLSNALYIGLSGLRANQQGLNVTGHNIANVSTEGYTRQQVRLESNKPIVFPIGVFGTGVNLAEIGRFRDAFIDRQFRDENNRLGSFEKQSESIDLLEGILNEPTDSGLQNQLKEFFNSLQDLSVSPESTSVRTTVREQGRALAQAFNQLHNQLDKLRDNKNFEITDKVSQINVILEGVASLNVQIASTEALGRQANDLRDNRDKLLDQLSKTVDMSASEDPANGSTTVSISGQSFVVLNKFQPIQTLSKNIDGKEIIQVLNPASGEQLKISSGELQGLLEIRDNLVPQLQDQIDTLAHSIIEEVNVIHRPGYGLQGGRTTPPTGINFFDGQDAQTIQLTPEIENDPGNIAASQSGAPGDNSNALALAQLRDKPVLNNNNFTFEDFYSGLVSSFGLQAVTIQDRLSNQTTLVDHLKNFRESQIGVNLDEEMVNLIQFQKAFGANARLITTTNDLMDIVVNLGRY